MAQQQFGREGALAGFETQQQAQQAQNAAIAQNTQLALQSGQFANQAQAQQFAQRLSAGEFGREAQMASFQTGQAALTQQAAANAAQQQRYNQMAGAAGFQNQAVQQQLAQQMALRNQPLNEISALLSGSQVQMPQFQGYAGQTIAPTPYLQAMQAGDAAAVQRYGIAANQAASNMSGLYGLAGNLGSAAIMFSDRRLKSNIERVGTHPLGIGLYDYDIGGERQRGVMADEVEQVLPEAVLTRPDGYKMVNYGLL